MDISRFDDAAAFLDHAGPFLRADAIDNNVMLGIAGRLVDAPQGDAVMLTVDEARAPRLAALMTPPWRLVVSTGSMEAIAALVGGMLETGPRLPGVIGRADIAGAFAAAWRRATAEVATVAHEMNLLIAARATKPADVAGRLRAAGTGDSEWVAGAYQNSTWVIGVAKAGCKDGNDLMGGSVIIAPTGEIVAQCRTLADELIVADCDLDACNFGKQTIFNFAAHRRIEHYGLITERTGAEPPPE